MLLLANGALRVAGEYHHDGSACKMRQAIQTLLTDHLTYRYNTRPLFCSSTHAPGLFHHH